MRDRGTLPTLLQGQTLIVGLGLMGASLAKGIKDLSASAWVVGLDRKEQPILRGLEEKVLDQGAVLSVQEDSVRSLIRSLFYPCTPTEFWTLSRATARFFQRGRFLWISVG